MGLMNQGLPESDPEKFFENIENFGEIKLSKRAAIIVCKKAENRLIWLLGVDVGILDEKGKYIEDFNEGWVTKTGMMHSHERKNFENGITSKNALHRNNLTAAQSIEQAPSNFNAFVLTAKLVRIRDVNN